MSHMLESLRAKEQLLLQDYIKEQNLNRSRVRQALLDLVGEQLGIFSPDDLIHLAKERRISVGETTVYNCIVLFIKAGILIPLPMGLSGSLMRATLCHGNSLALCRHCGEALLCHNAQMMGDLEAVTPPRWSSPTPLLLYWGVCPTCYRLGYR